MPTVTTITAVGDIMLGRRVGRAHADDPVASPSSRWPGGCPSVRHHPGQLRVDAVAGDGRADSGRRLLRRPTRGRWSGLHDAGFSSNPLVSLANNHFGDYGDPAMRPDPRPCSLAARICRTVGAGDDLTAARRPVIVARQGVRVGFLAVDSIGETPAAGADRPGTNRLDMPPRTGPLNRTPAAPDHAADIAALGETGSTPSWC